MKWYTDNYTLETANEIVDIWIFLYLCISYKANALHQATKLKKNKYWTRLPATELMWSSISKLNRSPKEVSWEHLYTTPELIYMYIMSTWNTRNINNTAWKFTMNLSNKYSTWTISSNRIHFTRTLYISFWRMEIKLLLTCTWNWHWN